MSKLHRQKPDIRGWRDELSSRFEIKEIIFFADFSNPTIRQEIPRIREVSNYIIETQNTFSGHKKDFTDFIMLDHIYQKAISSSDIDTFILFSGDGHFNSVSNYLITQLGKEVGVYAVRGGMSQQLKNTASWVELLPKNEDPMLAQYRMILSALKRLQENKGKRALPTFWGTVEAVSREHHLKRREVAEAMRALMKLECISQSTQKLPDGKTVKLLIVDWKTCKVRGVWE